MKNKKQPYRSKYVKAWDVVQRPSGIYSVEFIVSQKGILCIACSDTLFMFETIKESQQDDFTEGCLHNIPKFLPDDVDYDCAISHHKTTIIVYFVPNNGFTDNVKILFSSDTEENETTVSPIN